MKRVFFIRRAYSFGGAEKRLLDWLGAIDYSRNEVYVVSPVDVFSEKIRELGIPAKFVTLPERQLNSLFGPGNPLYGKDDLACGRFWQFFGPWLRFLWRMNPDQVVFMQGYFFSVPLACVAAAYIVTQGHVYMTDHSVLLQGPPRKTTRVHWGVLPGVGLWWYRRVWPSVWPWRLRASLSQGVLAASKSVMDREIEFYDYPPQKMAIINHGVDTDRFSPSAENGARWRQLHSIPKNDLVIVCTGRLHVQKRIDRLLKAFVEIAAKRSDLWLILAGDGPTRADLEAFRSSLHGEAPAPRIKLLGHVEGVAPVLQAADIFVLPSDSEGFGIALIEAMATGLVCVSTAMGGPSEIISEGENGFLVEVTEAGLLSGLRKALQLTRQERQQMGRHARQTVLSKYDVRSAVHHALGLLHIDERPGTTQRASVEKSAATLPQARLV